MFNQIELKRTIKEQADSLFEIGLEFSDFELNEKALQSLLEAQNLYQQIDDKLSVAKADFRIGEILLRQDKTSQAVQSLSSSADFLIEKGQHHEVAERLMKYGEQLKEKQKFDDFTLLTIPLSKALERGGFLIQAHLLMVASCAYATEFQKVYIQILCHQRLKEIELAIWEIEFHFRNSSRVCIA